MGTPYLARPARNCAKSDPCTTRIVPLDWPLRADVAQLVEHNLAKVGVAGSNPVVRSIDTDRRLVRGSREPGLNGQPSFLDSGAQAPQTATWPSGKAEACKAFIPGSNPGVASKHLPAETQSQGRYGGPSIAAGLRGTGARPSPPAVARGFLASPAARLRGATFPCDPLRQEATDQRLMVVSVDPICDVLLVTSGY